MFGNMKKMGKKELIILVNATSPSIDDCEKLLEEGFMKRAGIRAEEYEWVNKKLEELTEKKLLELYNRY